MKKLLPLAGSASPFKTTFAYSLSALLAASPAFSQTVPSNTLPTGGSVSAGAAAISQSGAVMNVQQSTNRAAVNWNTFDVGQSATVNFQQPSASSVTLNRVLDTNPSQIFGQINANGQIYLVNPNGIYFGPTARVDVGGLVATTHSMSDADFMAGKTTFDRNGSTGKVINDGTITSKLGGYIALLAPEVRNAGVIVAQSGTVALASGEAVTLNIDPANSLTNILVTPSKIDALVENRKIVKAPDGQVILSAQAFNELNAGIIKNSGDISAVGVTKSGGRVFLGASRAINQSGTIAASSSAGKGGTVKLNAKTVTQSGSIDVSSTVDKGGRVEITGDNLTLSVGSSIDATGPLGGGTVLVGGDWQGSNGVEQATTVLMEQGATIDASATQNGDGGTVVLWSDIHNAASTTTALGSILAMGGPNGGNGGKVETSGHRLAVDGFSVSTLALNGEAGLWLLDPYNVTIGASGNSGSYVFNSSTYTPSQDSSTIAASTISSALNSGNVTIVTGGGGSQTGTINVTSAITKTSGGNASLMLQAADTITIDAPISSTSGKLDVTLRADNDMGVNNGLGIVLLKASITTNGGAIAFGDGSMLSINGVTTKVGGDVYVGGSSEIVLDTRIGTNTTGGGSITVNGETMIGNTNGLKLMTGGGNVAFTGLLNSANSYTYVGLTNGATGTNNWDQARLAAKSGSGDGSAVGDGYLATITSRLENSIAIGTADYNSAWLGALRGGLGYAGQSTDWYWVTGPEGLQNSGRGLAFYNQATNTAINGAYTNWTAGEPNGTGTNALTSEMAMQFWYAQGQWNDLNLATTYPSGFVKETNLAASKLTINAAAGNVTFGGAIGGNKAIGDLNITANAISMAASATTEGSQTYNGNVALTNANIALTTKGPAASGFDILFNNGITKSGAGDANLTVKAHRDIFLNSNVAASGGKLNLLLEADYEDNWGSVSHDGAGFIQVNNNITTNGGTLQLGSNATATIGGATVKVGGDLYVAGNTAQTFSTGGGTIAVNGETLIANTAGLTVNSGGGSVLFGDEINSANSYAYVSGTMTWDAARLAANSGTGGGTGDTYLATITSRLENSISIRAANYATAWLGGIRGGTGYFGMSADWYWVTGTEGLANAGRGLKFFTQTGNGTGTTVAGGYSNWSNSEPNNFTSGSGSTNYTNGTSTGELTLQFTGVNGQWNDLSWTSQDPSGYIKETNLASSALTVNAGTGTLTINGGIGGSKALASLNVTAASTAINGDSVITTGAQSFNNALAVTSTGNLTLGGSSLAVTNSGQALTVNAEYTAGAIVQQAGLDITSAGTVQITGGSITLNDTVAGSGNVLLNGNGAVTLASGSAISSSAGNIGIKAARFRNNAGSSALNVSANNYWQVWSTNADPFNGTTGDTRGGLAYNYKQYNATYGVTTVEGTGNGFLYTYAPNLTVSLIGSTTKTYDAGVNASLSASNYSFSGTVDGDSAVLNNPTVGVYTSVGTGVGIADVGTGKTVQVTGLTVTSASKGSIAVYGYGVASATVSASIGAITKAPLTVSANADAKFVTQSDAALFNSVSYAGFVGGQTSGTAGVTGTLAITRSNSGVNSAGNYTGVLVPSGLTSGNYAITYANGDYQIVPADQLLVRATNLTTTYGAAPTYAITSAQYLNGSNVVQTLSAPTQTGNTFAYSDGSGGTATFTLGAAGALTSTSGKLQVGAYSIAASSISATSANFSNNLVIVGSHTVEAKNLTASATAGISKVYDGTTDMIGLTLGFTGLVTNDIVTGMGTGAFSSKAAGLSRTYTVDNLELSGADARNYYLSGGRSFTGANGTIAQRALTLSFGGIDKVYDGNTTATVTVSDNRLTGDTLSVVRTATFADKNVATGKAVSITGVSLTGADSGNYSVTATGSTTATITRLSSVAWTGPASGGNWFDPANWAGGAVPDLSNVENVVIPSGTVVNFGTTVVAPAEAGPVNVNRIGTAGGLNVTGGALNVAGGGMQLAGLTQSGGAISNSGTTTVTNLTQSGGTFAGTGTVTAGNFAQTGGSFNTAGSFAATNGFSQGSSGSMNVGGNTTITDPSGGVVLGNLTTGGALNVNSTGGAITQAAGTALAVTGASNLVATNGGAPAEITLANAANTFGGVVSGSGSNISLFGATGLTLGNVTASGSLNASVGSGKLALLPGSTQTASGGIKLTPDPRPVLIVYPQTASNGSSVAIMPAASSYSQPANANRLAVSEGNASGNARNNAITVSGEGLVQTNSNLIPVGKAVSLRSPDAQGRQIQTASIDVDGCSSCSFQFDRSTSVSAVDNGQGKITLSGTAPIEDYEKLLQSVQLSLAPGATSGPIKLRVSITDALGRKSTKVITIQQPTRPAPKVADAAPQGAKVIAQPATKPTLSIRGGRLVSNGGVSQDVVALSASR